MRNYRSQSEDSQVRGPDQTCNSNFGTEVRQLGKAACEDSLSTASGKMWLVQDLTLYELFVKPSSPRMDGIWPQILPSKAKPNTISA